MILPLWTQIAVSSKGFLAAADDSGDVKVFSMLQVYAHKCRQVLQTFLSLFNKYYEIPCAPHLGVGYLTLSCEIGEKISFTGSVKEILWCTVFPVLSDKKIIWQFFWIVPD
jgi:hypothetical protein